MLLPWSSHCPSPEVSRWSGGGRALKETTLLGNVFCLCSISILHLGVIAQLLQQTGSALHPHRQQDQPPPLLPRQLELALHQPANKKLLFACVILDYCSISRSPGKLAYAELVASALPSSLAAEAELPPGFDLSWSNFDGQRPAEEKKKALGSCCVCVFGKRIAFQKHLGAQTALLLEGNPSLVAGAVAKTSPKSAAFSSKAVRVRTARKAAGPGWDLLSPHAAAQNGAPVRGDDIPSELHHGLAMAERFDG